MIKLYRDSLQYHQKESFFPQTLSHLNEPLAMVLAIFRIDLFL